MNAKPIEFEFKAGEVIRNDTYEAVVWADCRLGPGTLGLTPAKVQEAVALWVKESEPKLPDGWNGRILSGRSYASQDRVHQIRVFSADLTTIDMFKQLIVWTEWHIAFDGMIGGR